MVILSPETAFIATPSASCFDFRFLKLENGIAIPF